MPRHLCHLLPLFFSAAAALGFAANERIELAWPTPNKAWEEGRSIEAFLQPTGSGDPASGGFGGVRSGGAQFHEGIDIKALNRDRRGEPTDKVYAAMAGVVRHISAHSGDSNYGRYIVLEHPDCSPAIYTLYAHLASILPGIREGVRVERGQPIAIMGHSASGYSIPRDRAHLHFEMGVMVTRDFQTWYNWKKFGSPNDHGLWNGMNLMGFDPLEFFNDWREHRIGTVQDFFTRMRPQVRFRIATSKTPDFIQRYPSLLKAPLPAGLLGGWEIECEWTGIPISWRPLSSTEVIGLQFNRPSITWVDHDSVAQHRSKVLVRPRGGGYGPGHDLEMVLQQLFEMR